MSNVAILQSTKVSILHIVAIVGCSDGQMVRCADVIGSFRGSAERGSIMVEIIFGRPRLFHHCNALECTALDTRVIVQMRNQLFDHPIVSETCSSGCDISPGRFTLINGYGVYEEKIQKTGIVINEYMTSCLTCMYNDVPRCRHISRWEHGRPNAIRYLDVETAASRKITYQYRTVFVSPSWTS